MITAHDSVDKAVTEVDRLRRVLKRNRTAQVWSTDEKHLIKATALAWFNNHHVELTKTLPGDILLEIDQDYKKLISATDRATSRARYDSLLKSLRRGLVELRGHTLTVSSTPRHTADEPPEFSGLISDAKMKAILERRWKECVRCIEADAPLAATVMMGGLLEALLLARVNRDPNKSPIFNASKAPKDRVTGKTMPLAEWTLRHYIDIAHELRWISQSAKDVGEILRDYRNYVHPQKELSHGVALDKNDATLFWEISKNISRQLL
jgi:hypothetical protein